MHYLCQYTEEHPFVYHMQDYDAACCPLCNEWLEESCNDEHCEYCVERPSMPLTTAQHEIICHLIQQYARTSEIPPEHADMKMWNQLLNEIESVILKSA